MESDLGPVIGGIDPIKPIRKPFVLEDRRRRRTAMILACFAGAVMACGFIVYIAYL